MALGNYIRTKEHNKHISDAKKEYYSHAENLAKHKQARMGVKRHKNLDYSQDCIKRKGVLYYRFACIDCGKPHYAQKIKGQARNLRCESCAAIIRGTGRVLMQETKEKISASLMGHKGFNSMLGKHQLPESIKKRTESIIRKYGEYPRWRKGQHHTPEAKIKISVAQKKRFESEEQREAISKRQKGKKLWQNRKHPMLGKNHSEDVRQVISQCSLEWHRTHAHPRLGYKATELERQHIGDCSRERWANPEYRTNIIKKITQGNFRRPTKPEIIVSDILNEICPNEYRYSGNGTVVLGGYVPDFIDVDGKKKVIEVYGDYWHSEKLRGRTKKEEEDRKKLNYATYGYDCLFIWEKELKDIEAVKQKVAQFVKA